jgi:hypothetical protein
MHSLEIWYVLLASLLYVMEIPSNGCSGLGDIECMA